MRRLLRGPRGSFRVGIILNLLGITMTIGVALLAIGVIFFEMRAEALRTAEETAQIILQHNLATHAYLNQRLKPEIFAISKGNLPEEYFSPTWMASTYAVREIDALFRAGSGMGEYYYKEAAINARSPQNEADATERAFLEALNRDPSLTRQAALRALDGQPFFEVMVRGESMTADCLRCHSTPERAPQQMVAQYGSLRSFGRVEGEVVSAVSIRMPLTVAYQSANRVVWRTGLIVGLVMLAMLVGMRVFIARLLVRPLETVRVEALRIAAGESPLGEQIPLPPGRELRDLTAAFNRLSQSLSQSQSSLEEQIEERTRELAQSKHLVQKVLDLTPSGLSLYDVTQDRFVYVNQQTLDYFGVARAEFLAGGKEFALAHIHPDDLILYQAQRAGLAVGKDGAKTQLRARGSGGAWNWLNFSIQVVERDEAGRPRLLLYIADDITQEHEAAERLRYTSTHDALTGLYNWAYFEEAFAKIFYGDEFPASIIMMDVDNLKTINDSVGHVAGDELLRQIGGLLLSEFRAEDTVVRLGGDEFAALLPKVDEEKARQIIQRLRTRLAEATRVAGIRLDVLSIGLHTALSPEDLQDARHKADQDMYRDKQQRKISKG